MNSYRWILISLVLLDLSCSSPKIDDAAVLKAKIDNKLGTISIFRGSEDEPVLVQNARQNFRPYLHPIMAPDGKGPVTEYSPEHHKHQTGL